MLSKRELIPVERALWVRELWLEPRLQPLALALFQRSRCGPYYLLLLYPPAREYIREHSNRSRSIL